MELGIRPIPAYSPQARGWLMMISHLNRALTLNPNLLEALFNRALCREYMGQPQAAVDDWRQYLEKDPQSRWTDEARQHLKQIESQIPKGSQNKDDMLLGFNAYAASTMRPPMAQLWPICGRRKPIVFVTLDHPSVTKREMAQNPRWLQPSLIVID